MYLFYFGQNPKYLIVTIEQPSVQSRRQELRLRVMERIPQHLLSNQHTLPGSFPQRFRALSAPIPYAPIIHISLFMLPICIGCQVPHHYTLHLSTVDTQGTRRALEKKEPPVRRGASWSTWPDCILSQIAKVQRGTVSLVAESDDTALRAGLLPQSQQLGARPRSRRVHPQKASCPLHRVSRCGVQRNGGKLVFSDIIGGFFSFLAFSCFSLLFLHTFSMPFLLSSQIRLAVPLVENPPHPWHVTHRLCRILQP